MKRIYLLAVLVIAGCGGHVSFTPTPTASTITIQCPKVGACGEYQVYRINGICPSVLDNSTGWSIVGTTTDSVFVDSNVSAGNTYSYNVESSNGTLYSGPSNCVTRSL